MMHDQFNLLTPHAQLLHVLRKGVYLARRWVKQDSGINLYYLSGGRRGFFAEVGISEAEDCFVVLRSFSDSEALEDYAHGVRLPK